MTKKSDDFGMRSPVFSENKNDKKKKWYLLPLIIARGRQDVTKGYGVMVAQAAGKYALALFLAL